MDFLTKAISQKFNGEFDFLKLLDVVYNKKDFCCFIIFLYPENVKEILQKDKKKIEDFLIELLSINANIIVKFKKSFLDEEIIKNHIISFFKTEHLSLFTLVKKDSIEIIKLPCEIAVTLKFSKEICKQIEEEKILSQLKNNLERNFISAFNLKTEVSNELIDESILEKRKNENFFQGNKIRRYSVFEPVILLGKEISPNPEFIKDQKKERENVILAGKISNFTKKTYHSKKSKDPNSVNYYYTFDINDTTGSIPTIFFSGKSNEEKLNKLEEGKSYLFLGDVRLNMQKKLQYYLKQISYCIFNEEQIKNTLNQKKQNLLANDYKLIYPKPFYQEIQETLFTSGKNYSDFILKNKIVVFDLETTGLDPENFEIIEIGAVKIEYGVITETFDTLIKPKNLIPSSITEINHITNEMVENAPSCQQAILDFILFSKDCVLSGYNIIAFDMKFLRKAGAEIGFNFNNKIEDAILLARSNLRLANYTLNSVIKKLNITLNDAHRALNDAIATAKVLLELNKVEKLA